MFELNTDDVKIGDRFAYWQNTVEQIFPLSDVQTYRSHDFQGQLSWQHFAGVTVSDISSVRQRVSRSARQIRQDEADFFELNYQLEGSGIVRQCGREARTRPGEFTLYDSTKPFEMRFEGRFRQLSLKVPRRLLREHYRAADEATATRLQDTYGLCRGLFAFAGHIKAGSDVVQRHCQDQLTGLLASALSVSCHEQSSVSRSQAALLERLKSITMERLGEPDLSPRIVADAAGISMRYAYAVFESEGLSIAKWIVDQRLKRCRADLRDPMQAHRTVSEIAFFWGFSNAAHFSRAFRTAFGVSPTQMRCDARLGKE